MKVQDPSLLFYPSLRPIEGIRFLSQPSQMEEFLGYFLLWVPRKVIPPAAPLSLSPGSYWDLLYYLRMFSSFTLSTRKNILWLLPSPSFVAISVYKHGGSDKSEEAVVFILFLVPSSFEVKLGYKKQVMYLNWGFWNLNFTNRWESLEWTNSKLESSWAQM